MEITDKIVNQQRIRAKRSAEEREADNEKMRVYKAARKEGDFTSLYKQAISVLGYLLRVTLPAFRTRESWHQLRRPEIVCAMCVQILLFIAYNISSNACALCVFSADAEKAADELGVYTWARNTLVTPLEDFSSASYFVRARMFAAERAYRELNDAQKQYMSAELIPRLVNFVELHIGGADEFSGNERWRWNGAT